MNSNNNIKVMTTEDDSSIISTQIQNSCLDRLNTKMDKMMTKIENKIENINEKNHVNLKDYYKQLVLDQFNEIKNEFSNIVKVELGKELNIIKSDIENLKVLLKSKSNEHTAVCGDPNQATIITDNLTSCNTVDNCNRDIDNHNLYSSAIKTKTKTSKINGERIIIKPVNGQNCSDTVNKLKNSVDVANLGIKINKIINSKDGKVIVDVEKKSDTTTLGQEIIKTFGEEFKVTAINKRLPKIKIVNLEKEILQLEDDVIIDTLIKQNKWSTDDSSSKIKVIRRYKKASGYGSIILEASPKLYKVILEQNLLSFKWNEYRVF